MNIRKYIDVYSHKEKSRRHFRFRKQRRKKIRKIYGCVCAYPSGYVWSDEYQEWILPGTGWDRFSKEVYDFEFGNFIPTKKAYPKRYYRCKGSKYLKKYSHKLVRRNNNEYIGKGNKSNLELDFGGNFTKPR